METITVNTKNNVITAEYTNCPYSDKSICKASLSSLIIDGNTITAYCGTENFDDCPIFLSRILRGRGRV